MQIGDTKKPPDLIGRAVLAQGVTRGYAAWLVLSLVVCAVLGLVVGVTYLAAGMVPIDLPWDVNPAYPYAETWDAAHRYVYPPTVAQFVALLHLVPGGIALWIVGLFLAVWLAYGRWTVPLLALGLTVPAFSLIVAYPINGNLQPVIAAVCVLGLRYPALWSVALLSKIGPGIGVLWFVFRREWRQAVIALGATAAIALVSFVAAPQAWSEFVSFAIHNYATPSPSPVVPIPLSLRLPMSLVLLWWGARTDRPWTVPIAAGWAALALYEWSFVPVWVAALNMAKRPAPKDRPVDAGDRAATSGGLARASGRARPSPLRSR